MIEKKALVEAIAKRINVSEVDAQAVVDDVIAELVSPLIFGRPGEEAGFINDNNCKNNCKELQLAGQQVRR